MKKQKFYCNSLSYDIGNSGVNYSKDNDILNSDARGSRVLNIVDHGNGVHIYSDDYITRLELDYSQVTALKVYLESMENLCGPIYRMKKC